MFPALNYAIACQFCFFTAQGNEAVLLNHLWGKPGHSKQRARVAQRMDFASGTHLKEIHELLRMRAVAKVEVEALVALLDVHALLVGSMLHYELLEEHKGSLVPHMLPHLHHGCYF